MGRDLPDLTLSHVMAMRRHIFFDQPMPAWVLKFAAMPTHIMIVNGVYVRVLWVSQPQLEEIYLYAYSCYLSYHKNRKPSDKLTIMQFPTVHRLSEMCRGRSPVFFQEKRNRPTEASKDTILPVRTMENQICCALAVIEPQFYREGAADWSYPNRDILVDHDELVRDEFARFLINQNRSCIDDPGTYHNS